MNTMIKYEDQDILVIHKPAGIATETSKIGQADVVSELKNYRKKKGEDTYIGVIHRLDQPVEGLLVFAKNQKAAKQLSADLSKGYVKKKYYALVSCEPQTEKGKLEDYLLKDPKTNLSSVVSKETNGAKYASLTWRLIKTVEYNENKAGLVEIVIDTGRHHQIRTQMANAGMPLVGDHKYGNSKSKEISDGLRLRQTALFAGYLHIKHPANGEDMEFEISLPKQWKIN